MGGPSELVEVREFLAAHAPFDELPHAELLTLVGEIRIEYFRRGTPFIRAGRTTTTSSSCGRARPTSGTRTASSSSAPTPAQRSARSP